MEHEVGRPSSPEPWTTADIWWLVARAAFWLVGFAVMGALRQAWRWRVLRARYF
jgi:hypothetical protein